MDVMRHFLLARELPAIFALCLVGALLAFENAQPAWAIWLLFAALWCFLLWVILLPGQRAAPRDHQHEQQQRQRRQSKQRAKRCRTA